MTRYRMCLDDMFIFSYDSYNSINCSSVPPPTQGVQITDIPSKITVKYTHIKVTFSKFTYQACTFSANTNHKYM